MLQCIVCVWISIRELLDCVTVWGVCVWVSFGERTHLHLVTVEEMDVGPVLLIVLAHKQQHRGVAGLIQHRLAHVHRGQWEVLQLLLTGPEEDVQFIHCHTGNPSIWAISTTNIPLIVLQIL